MTEQEASLIIRQHMALADEGIGPAPIDFNGERVTPTEDDNRILDEAVRIAGHLFAEWRLQECGLVPD